MRLAGALRVATGTDIVSRVSFTRRSVCFFVDGDAPYKKQDLNQSISTA